MPLADVGDSREGHSLCRSREWETGSEETIEAYSDIVSVILGDRVLDPVRLAANHSRASLDGN